MDKEAQKIQDILKGFCRLDYDDYVVGFDHYRAAEHLYKLGYRKLPKDKPPLLEGEDGHEFRRTNDVELAMTAEDAFDYGFEEGSQAQGELDIKHYETLFSKK